MMGRQEVAVGNVEEDVIVSKFEYSIDKFLEASDMISSLCGEHPLSVDSDELQRSSSMITFLEEWKHFYYEPKILNFAYEPESLAQHKHAVKGICLPQFSSVRVPKMGCKQMKEPPDSESGKLHCEDFLLHAGGSIWALDWCPKVGKRSDSRNTEYLAISAHPMGSSYHQMGIPLMGRGFIQIWCMLCAEEEPKSMVGSNHGNIDVKAIPKRPRGRPRKQQTSIEEPSNPSGECLLTQPKRHRGRPQKQLVGDCQSSELKCKRQRPTKQPDKECVPSQPKRPRGRPRKQLPANISSETDTSTLTEVLHLSGCGSVQDKYSTREAHLCERGQSSGMNENFKIERSPQLCAQKIGRGSCKKRAGLLKFLDVIEHSNEFDESSLIVHASNGIKGDIQEESGLRFESDAKVLDENFDSLGSEKKQSLTRRGTGRPGKKQADALSFDTLKDQSLSIPITDVGGKDSLSVSDDIDVTGVSSCPPARDFEESCNKFEADEMHMAKTVGGLNTNRKQSLTRKHMGNSKKKLAGDTWKDQCMSQILRYDMDDKLLGGVLANANGKGKQLSRGRIRGKSVQMESLDVSHAMNILNEVYIEEDGLISLSEYASSSHGISEMNYENEKDQTSESYFLNKGKSFPSNGCKANILKGLNKANSIDGVDPLENSDISMSNKPFISLVHNDSIGQPNEVSTEPVRECSSSTSMPCNLYQGHSEKESNHQNEDTQSKGTIHTWKRKIKDKARKLSSASVTPNWATNNTEEKLYVHDSTSPLEKCAQGLASKLGHATPLKMSYSDYHKNVTLPRVVLCLSHMGEVAWDVKWRPHSTISLEKSRHTLGYLAAVLGDGSLEVWEVPLPAKVNILYNSCGKEGTDPRFIRVKPVFRCSVMKCGDRKSIPLTVEWSPGSPSDLILAGCHDGTVALWKFTSNDSSPDTRPLLCFTADTAPIRAVAWAPENSDTECANLFVTAGNERLRIWDIRDPYCPLWEFNPVKRHILSVDWLKNPSCILLSFDDGSLRVISLSEAVASESPAELLSGIRGKHHYYFCSGFPIWSVHVSRMTGQVAYCGADGLTSRFQLTVKMVEKHSSRHRQPHFLCGSLTKEDQNLCVTIPFPSVPLEDTPRHGRSLHVDPKHARIENSNTAGSSQQNSSVKFTSKLKESEVEKESPTEVTNLICATNNNKVKGKFQGTENQVGGEIWDVFPSKHIAMHKVRWNMNHGSERWLCYGGAAGIVRCQEIFMA